MPGSYPWPHDFISVDPLPSLAQLTLAKSEGTKSSGWLSGLSSGNDLAGVLRQS
jgi:hypothetical protein